MRSFDNLKRWQELRDYAQRDSELTRLLRELLKESANHLRDADLELADISDLTETISHGSNRQIFRLGIGRSRVVTIDDCDLVLAVKIGIDGSRPCSPKRKNSNSSY